MKYRYIGDADRYYPVAAVTPEPGSEHEFDVPPTDGRWEPAEPIEETSAPASAPTIEEG